MNDYTIQRVALNFCMSSMCYSRAQWNDAPYADPLHWCVNYFAHTLHVQPLCSSLMLLWKMVPFPIKLPINHILTCPRECASISCVMILHMSFYSIFPKNKLSSFSNRSLHKHEMFQELFCIYYAAHKTKHIKHA